MARVIAGTEGRDARGGSGGGIDGVDRRAPDAGAGLDARETCVAASGDRGRDVGASSAAIVVGGLTLAGLTLGGLTLAGLTLGGLTLGGLTLDT